MTPKRLLETGIIPALKELEAHAIKDSIDARRLMMAIALQESGLKHRRQVVQGGAENGPATSFYQGEVTGGMCLTLKHHRTGPIMKAICEAYNVEPTATGLWNAMRYNDVVASAAARLLIYTLPGKLPTNAENGWAQYIEGWRPGRPHPDKWAANWGAATLAVGMEL